MRKFTSLLILIGLLGLLSVGCEITHEHHYYPDTNNPTGGNNDGNNDGNNNGNDEGNEGNDDSNNDDNNNNNDDGNTIDNSMVFNFEVVETVKFSLSHSDYRWNTFDYSMKLKSTAPDGCPNSVDICYSTEPNPTIANNTTTAYKDSNGDLILKLPTDIDWFETYYIRAYSISGSNVKYYNNEISAEIFTLMDIIGAQNWKYSSSDIFRFKYYCYSEAKVKLPKGLYKMSIGSWTGNNNEYFGLKTSKSDSYQNTIYIEKQDDDEEIFLYQKMPGQDYDDDWVETWSPTYELENLSTNTKHYFDYSSSSIRK